MKITQSELAKRPMGTEVKWPDPLEPAAYHGVAGELVRLIEPHSEADPAALLVQFLVAFGNLIGRHAYRMSTELGSSDLNMPSATTFDKIIVPFSENILFLSSGKLIKTYAAWLKRSKYTWLAAI